MNKLNGFKIQYGKTTPNGSNPGRTISIDFSTACVGVFFTPLRSSGEGGTDNIILLSLSKNSFTFSYHNHGSDYDVYWVALGY